MTREKASFLVSEKILRAQAPNIESQTWWLTRANMRGNEAYNTKANMQALNKVSKDPAAASKAYTKFWNEINSLDLACTKKELDLAKKEYSDVLAALAVAEREAPESSVIALFKQQDARDAAESEKRAAERAAAEPVARKPQSFRWPAAQHEDPLASHAAGMQQAQDSQKVEMRHERTTATQVTAGIRWEQGARTFEWPGAVVEAARSRAAEIGRASCRERV